MIRRKKFIFIILSSALLISGCGRNEAEDVQNYIQIEDGAEGFEELALDEDGAEEFDELVLAEDVDEGFDELDWKEDGDGGFRELTQEEMDLFTQFIHRMDAYGFVLSEYTGPSEVDLGEVFYSGAGFQKTLSEEEIAAYLAACNQEELYTDCVKITRSDVEKLLEERLGISLSDTDDEKIVLYIPEFDAYYHECGDTNYMEFSCVGGLANGNVYTLEFKAGMDWNYIYSDVQTILEKTESGYRFIANQSLAIP